MTLVRDPLGTSNVPASAARVELTDFVAGALERVADT
jgi:hypothetical protein